MESAPFEAIDLLADALGYELSLVKKTEIKTL